MFEKISLFAQSGSMARHAAYRQSTIAQNIANSDTPGYKSLAVPDFSTFASQISDATEMKKSRRGHWHTTREVERFINHTVERGSKSPNGNSVSLETELVSAAKAKHQHTTAISVYKAGLNIIRTSLGRL